MRRALIAATTTASLVLASGTALAAASSGHDDHARAATEAKAILTHAPTASGAAAVKKAPSALLRNAPEADGELGLVTRAHYWVTTGSAKAVFSQLTATTPNGFRQDGAGSAGDRSGVTMRFVDDSLKKLPAGIASGDLVIAVAALKDGKVGIGAYGEAAAQPPRPAAEDVPASVSSATVSWTLSMRDRHPLQRTISGATATRLVSAFNAMKVSILGPIPCPANFGEQQTATFVGGGHTWVATLGNCGIVSVVRDGKAQKALSIGSRFYRLMSHDLGIDGPKRPAAESVPSDVRQVRVVKTTASGSKSRTVTGRHAREIVDGFNELNTVRRGVLTCSATGTTVTTTFTTPQHTWVATEDPCELVSVTRDGKALPTLAEDGLWVQSLRQAHS